MLIEFDCPNGAKCAVRSEAVLSLHTLEPSANFVVDEPTVILQCSTGQTFHVLGTVPVVAAKLNGMDGAGGQLVPTEGALRPRHKRFVQA